MARKLETSAPIAEIEEAVRKMLDGLTKRAAQPQYKAEEGRIYDWWALVRLSACAEVLRLGALKTHNTKQRERLNAMAAEVCYLWSKYENPPLGLDPLRSLLPEGARVWLHQLRRPPEDPFVTGAKQAAAERQRAALLAEAEAEEAKARAPQESLERAAELRERAAAI